MSEFNNRIDAQRRILRIVNGSRNLREELFGLSSGALERWARANNVGQHNPLLELLNQARSMRLFLANKS